MQSQKREDTPADSHTMPMVIICPVCAGNQTELIQSIPNIPIFCNVLWRTCEAARTAPRGDVDLVFCVDCGHVFNPLFDLARMEYNLDYENSLHFSHRFQEYATRLAWSLIERHNLRGKTVLEIGSGKGDFLRLLAELGDNRGVGYDPSYQSPAEDELDDRVNLIRGRFEKLEPGLTPDLIYSRHTLEHLESPVEFMRTIRRATSSHAKTSIFIEVPNVDLIVKDLSVWDIIYEHYSYFSEASLGYLAEHTGFTVDEVSPAYQGQFLTLDAHPAAEPFHPVDRWAAQREDRLDALRRFSSAYHSKVEKWTARLQDYADQGKTVVLWGAGSKGVTFLNLLDGADMVRWIVDINPRKLGMFVSGAGQEIIAPEKLKTIRPDAIVVMNPIYQEEIRKTVGDLGLEPEFLYA